MEADTEQRLLEVLMTLCHNKKCDLGLKDSMGRSGYRLEGERQRAEYGREYGREGAREGGTERRRDGGERDEQQAPHHPISAVHFISQHRARIEQHRSPTATSHAAKGTTNPIRVKYSSWDNISSLPPTHVLPVPTYFFPSLSSVTHQFPPLPHFIFCRLFQPMTILFSI